MSEKKELLRPVARIEPRRRLALVDLRALWRFRDLWLAFAARDLKVRYKQTVLGGLWAILQPLTAMVLFTLVFGRLARMPSDNLPYPLFAYAGLLPWMFFAAIVNGASLSLVDSSRLLTKVYFPRLLVPTSVVGYALVDFALGFLILVGLMLYYGVHPGLRALAAPLPVLGIMATGLGAGVLLSALNAKYRDFRFVVPFLVQIWLFATPIIYPASLIPERYRWIASLNPMSGLTECFRAALLDTPLDWRHLAVSTAAGAALLVIGLVYFGLVEDELADVI